MVKMMFNRKQRARFREDCAKTEQQLNHQYKVKQEQGLTFCQQAGQTRDEYYNPCLNFRYICDHMDNNCQCRYNGGTK